MNTGRGANSAGAAVMIHIQDAPAPHIQDAPVIVHIQADAPTALELDEEEEIPPPIQERMAKAADKLEHEATKTMIHRLPASIQGIGGPDYTKPRVVAVGPYHHGSEHVRKMEEVKHAAANYFCRRSGCSTEEVYGRVRSVACRARRCYAVDDEAVTGLSDDDLALMMFLDGCFLLQYMAGSEERPFLSCDLMSRHSIIRDMMLLENQIPWLVLEALQEFKAVDVRRFVAVVANKLLPEKKKGWTGEWFNRGGLRQSLLRGMHAQPRRTGEWFLCKTYQEYKPAHLLDLLLFSQTYRMHEQRKDTYEGRWSPRSSNAVELTRMGVSLANSGATWLGDMSFTQNSVFGELSLSPVFLNDFTACWLVNLAALETIVDAGDWPRRGFVVNSYLSVLTMLMDRKEDVQQLRVNRLLQGPFSDKQVLGFFNTLAQHLSYGGRYFLIMESIDDYRDKRPVRMLVHRYLYDGYKTLTIATLGSIAGMLVGIFKTLLSKKQA